MELDAKIESILFFKGEPVAIKKIAEILEVPLDEVTASLQALQVKKEGTGLCVVITDTEATLGTHKEASIFLDKMRKDEITKELSKAALETLSIILYKNGVTRGEVDYIRGVNSSFIIRNLLVRGLVEKKVDASDSRRFIYLPTIELLKYMGVTAITELPKYTEVLAELNKTITSEQTENNE